MTVRTNKGSLLAIWLYILFKFNTIAVSYFLIIINEFPYCRYILEVSKFCPLYVLLFHRNSENLLANSFYPKLFMLLINQIMT